jgi:hypothetical protein
VLQEDLVDQDLLEQQDFLDPRELQEAQEQLEHQDQMDLQVLRVHLVQLDRLGPSVDLVLQVDQEI